MYMVIEWPPRNLKVTQNAQFSSLAHKEQLLLVAFCDTTAEIGASFRRMERQEEWMDR